MKYSSNSVRKYIDHEIQKINLSYYTVINTTSYGFSCLHRITFHYNTSQKRYVYTVEHSSCMKCLFIKSVDNITYFNVLINYLSYIRSSPYIILVVCIHGSISFKLQFPQRVKWLYKKTSFHVPGNSQ
jgi:hypothetical protein